jgi:acyl-CoA hydrolase
MEKMKLSHLVKSGELNHHGTLFAGQMAEWFVEACFINGAQITESPENIVCLKIHGFRFNMPTNNGDILHIETQMVKAGTTSFTVYGKATRNNDIELIADGFITFVFVNENGKPIPHNITLDEAKTKEEKELRKQAQNLT